MNTKKREDRRWQKLAWTQYIADNLDNWLLEVCPGGGKTYWALRTIQTLASASVIERVVVVVPTDHLRDQWIREAERLDIHLAAIENGEGGQENRDDFLGCVLTYAQVASDLGKEVHRRACGLHRTLVIFDEAHHAGDSKKWGEAIQYAFGTAVKRISMTGTPWRRPHHGKIPFVAYNEEGIVTPNFSYTTSEGVRQGYIRAAHFHAFDGSLTYQRLDIDSCIPQKPDIKRLGELEEDDTKPLQDILDADGPWLQSIFRDEAMPRLGEIIRGDKDCPPIPSAQGLIVVHDRTQARKAVKFVSRLTRERPALIIQPEEGDPDPKEELRRFKVGGCRWAIAVDMVSEGVDIPSIFLIIYATRKKTPLRVRQTVARAQRRLFEADQYEPPAQVLFPAVPSFMRVFADFEKDMLEACKYIEEEEREDIEDSKDRHSPDKDGSEPIEIVTSSEAMYYGTTARGFFFSHHDVRTMEARLEVIGVPAKYAINFLVDERTRGKTSDTQEPINKERQPMQEAEEMTRQDEWRMCRTALDKVIGTIAFELVDREYGRIKDGKIAINTQMLRWFNGKQRSELSIPELKEAIRRVKALKADKWNTESEE